MRFLIDLIGAILIITGAGSAEDIPEADYERFEHYSRHPLPVNRASAVRMLASGLFSAYQVAAIGEYRERSGDILGLTEFALVDGIGPEAAEALSLFVSFGSSLPPGAKEDTRVRQSLMLRGSARWKAPLGAAGPTVNPSSAPVLAGLLGNPSAAGGLKYHLQIGERAEAYLSARNSYASPDAVPGTVSMALYSRRGSRIIAGDFSARFGQGLALWSGFSISGFGGVSAFRRNASGFSPTGSFSPAFSGIAADVPLGRRWTLGAALSVGALRSFLAGNKGAFSGASENAAGVPAWLSLTEPDALVPMVCASYNGRRGSFSIQALRCGTSVSSSSLPASNPFSYTASASGLIGIGHWSIFGEAALSSALASSGGYIIRQTRPAGLGGVTWAPAYRVRFAALARYYPAGYYAPFSGAPRSASGLSDEIGAAFGAQWRWAELTLDAAHHPEKRTSQYKGILSLQPEFSLAGIALSPSLRCTERCRPEDRYPWRHELRADIKASRGRFLAACRADLVSCRDFGFLSYMELGFRTPPQSGSPAIASGSGHASPDLADSLGGSAAHSVLAGPAGNPSAVSFSAFIRASVFQADSWDDRIYCYERDLPGAFSVPAYYGRGWSLSALCGLKLRPSGALPLPSSSPVSRPPHSPAPGVRPRRFRPSHSFHLRASLIRYPSGSRPASTELKLQYQINM